MDNDSDGSCMLVDVDAFFYYSFIQTKIFLLL